MSIKLSTNEVISADSVKTETAPNAPIIDSFEVSGTDDLALDTAGGQTVVIRGKGFRPGLTVIAGGSTIGAVTVVDPTTITFTSQAASSGTYNLFVVNADGGTAILSPGLIYSGLPTFTTEAGSLGSFYETTSVSANVEATEGADTITYAVVSGSLPANVVFSANGVISGTAPVEGNSTTYTFTVEATDEENQSSTREFSLTINTDVVTWSSPAEGTTFDLAGNEAMSNITLSASSASGNGITYSANSLPNNIILTNDTISGTPDLEETVYTQLLATANNTGRSATRNITFVVSLGDAFFNQTTLLLNADDNNFITDASDNAFTITPNGDTRPSAFSPYNTSWSNYFDGNGDYLTIPGADAFALGTGDFTVELWAYVTASQIVSFLTSNYTYTSAQGNWSFYYNNGTYYFNAGGTNHASTTTLTLPLNSWTHIAYTRVSGTGYFWINGTQLGNGVVDTSNYGGSNTFYIGRQSDGSGQFIGYMSNARIVKGTAVYTSNFTPPTEPLTAIANTSLLTCQSNRLIDNSTNNFTITKNGDVKVTSFAPFTETDTSTGSGYFDGTGDYQSIADNAAFTMGTGDFTVEYWGYVPSAADMRAFGQVDSTPTLSSISIFGGINSSSKAYSGARSGTTEYACISSANYPLGQWVHHALVRDGTTLRQYINGVQDGTSNISTASVNDSSAQFSIGRIGEFNSLYWNGYVSNFRLVKGTCLYPNGTSFTPPTSPLTAITNTSLLTLQNRIGHNNSQPIDESGIKNVITRNGNASAGTFSPHVPTGWSGYFDGTGDYLTINPGAFTLENWHSQDTTIEMWVYPMVHAYSSANAIGLYLSHGTATAATTYWGLGTTNTGYLKWYYYPGTPTAITATTNPLSLNAWSHVALVYTHSTGAIKGYVNGTEVFSSTKSGTPQTPNTYDLNVGVAQGTYYTGYISNLRIKQGEAVYTSAFTPPTAPLEPDNNTSFLSLRSTNITDDGPNRLAITRAGDTKITPFSPFAPNTVTPDSYSVYFDGSGDYLTVPSGAHFADFGTGNFTVEWWEYIVSFPSQYFPVVNYGSLGDTSSFNTKFGIRYEGSGTKIRLGISGTYYDWTGLTTTLNVWRHCALVRSGTDVTLYRDGSAVSTKTISTDITAVSSTSIIGGAYFGDGGGTLYSAYGYISNLRTIKGTAVYTGNFTPPTAPLTAIANTSLLTCQSPTVIDNSTNEFAITVNGNSQPTQFNPFGETVTTGVQYSPASHGGSYYFDGTGDYLTCASPAGQLGSGNFTVECWVYLISAVNNRPGICSNYASYGTGDFSLFAAHGGFSATKYTVFMNGSTPSIASNAVVKYAEWTHLAVVRIGSTVSLYINGSLDNTATQSATLDGDGVMYVGASGDNTTKGMHGYVNNFRVIKGTALYTSNFVPPQAPADPIAGTTLLINGTNAAIQDKSGRNVLETVGNARVLNGVKKYGSGAMYFDGTGDYLAGSGNVNTQMGTGAFTWECWCYITNTAAYQCFIDTRPVPTNGSSTGMGFILNTGTLTPIAATTDTILTSSINVTQNAWTHIALTRTSGGTLTIWVNGVSGGSVSNSSNLTDNALFVGGNSSSPHSAFVNGYIDDLRITKGVARYTANFTPPTSTHKLK